MTQPKTSHSVNCNYTDSRADSRGESRNSSKTDELGGGNLLAQLGYDGAPEAPLGLSKATYLTKGCQVGAVEVAIDGNLVRRISLEPREDVGQVGGGRRGTITQFSAQSRNRLLMKLANLRGGAFEPGLFITLTYPVGEADARQAKVDLDLFLKRLRYRFPAAAGVWKLEYQRNGTPHFHILVLGLDFWLMTDMRRCWAEVVGSNHPAHERVGTQVQPILSQRHAAAYMCKYVAKDGRIPEDHFGRIWGVFGDLGRFESRKITYGLTSSEVVKLRRVFDAWRKGRTSKPFRRSAAVQFGQKWFMDGMAAHQLIEGLLRDTDGGDPPPWRDNPECWA